MTIMTEGKDNMQHGCAHGNEHNHEFPKMSKYDEALAKYKTDIDDAGVRVAAGLFQFADVVTYTLVVAAEKLAHGHHDVYLRGAVFHGQCGLGHLDFYQRL